MYNIKTMNKIAAVGLDCLPAGTYAVGDAVENEDAILVRSAKLHDYGGQQQGADHQLLHGVGVGPGGVEHHDARLGALVAGELANLDVLLFQLDSEMLPRKQGGGDLVLWGDCGVCNFFINREALRLIRWTSAGAKRMPYTPNRGV